jgi:hypothetical protein
MTLPTPPSVPRRVLKRSPGGGARPWHRWRNLPTYAATWLIPGGRRLWGIYVYFRWLDDVVDDPAVDREEKARLVAGERSFLEALYSAAPGTGPTSYERGELRRALRGVRDDAELKQRLLALVDSFAFDVARLGGRRVPREELMAYSRDIGAAYTCALARLAGLRSLCGALRLEFHHKYGRDIEAALAEYAHYCHLVHVLRDRALDQRIGYDNVPLEYEGFEAFARETAALVRSRFKAVEYEHFFLLAKYRASPLLSLAAFLYYSRFVVQLQAVERALEGHGPRPRWSLCRALWRFLLNRFYYLEDVPAECAAGVVRHRPL